MGSVSVILGLGVARHVTKAAWGQTEKGLWTCYREGLEIFKLGLL